MLAMNYILLIVILLLIAFIVYQDYMNRKEREALELKLMSKSTEEYKRATEKTPESTKEEPEHLKDLEDVPMDRLLHAEDNL